MESRIMQIYYGNDRLPYKDKGREVHYPMVGSLITGENNTTKVYFYVGKIGGALRQWVADIKKPDGTLSYQLLNVGREVDNDYLVELDISYLYANQTGRVELDLKVIVEKSILKSIVKVADLKLVANQRF